MAFAVMFEIGANVSYSSLGSGIVEGIDSVLIDGVESNFYIVKFEMNGITLKVPVNDEKIRLVVNADEMNEVMEALRGEGNFLVNIPSRWNKRSSLYSEIVSSGDILKIAKLANILHLKKKKTFNETRIAENCCKIIASEFSCVNSVEFDKALDIVLDVVKKNSANTIKV